MTVSCDCNTVLTPPPWVHHALLDQPVDDAPESKELGLPSRSGPIHCHGWCFSQYPVTTGGPPPFPFPPGSSLPSPLPSAFGCNGCLFSHPNPRRSAFSARLRTAAGDRRFSSEPPMKPIKGICAPRLKNCFCGSNFSIETSFCLKVGSLAHSQDAFPVFVFMGKGNHFLLPIAFATFSATAVERGERATVKVHLRNVFLFVRLRWPVRR